MVPGLVCGREPHVRVRVPHHREGVQVQAYCGGRAHATHPVPTGRWQADCGRRSEAEVPRLQEDEIHPPRAVPRRARRQADLQVLSMRAAVPGQPGIRVPPRAAPVHHAGPDAVGHGDGGGQHTDDAQTFGGQGACGHHNPDTGTLFHYGMVERHTETLKPPCTGDK